MISRNYFVIIPRHPVLRAYEVVFQQPGVSIRCLFPSGARGLGAIAALVLTVPGAISSQSLICPVVERL